VTGVFPTSLQLVCDVAAVPLVLPSEVDMSSPLTYGTPSSRVEGTPRSGVRGTPARQRPDLGSVRKSKQVDLHSEPVSMDLMDLVSYWAVVSPSSTHVLAGGGGCVFSLWVKLICSNVAHHLRPM